VATTAIDPGSVQQAGTVTFITRSAADGSAITREFTVTRNGGNTSGPFPADASVEARSADAPLPDQILGFDITTSIGGNVGVVDIRVLTP